MRFGDYSVGWSSGRASFTWGAAHAKPGSGAHRTGTDRGGKIESNRPQGRGPTPRRDAGVLRPHRLSQPRRNTVEPGENGLTGMGMFSTSIEVGGDGWCTSWVPELPGCFVNVSSERAALRALPAAILAYLRWLRRHGESVRVPRTVAVRLVERHARPEPMRWGNYEVLHGFERRRLTREEVSRMLRWMRFIRQDTLRLLDLLPAGGLNWSRPGQTRTIGENLHHVARGELWYLSRVALGPPPSVQHAEDPLLSLAQARSTTVARLSRMTREERGRIIQADNRRWWSARKMLGRMLYHERYHVRSMARIARHHRVRVPDGLGGWGRY